MLMLTSKLFAAPLSPPSWFVDMSEPWGCLPEFFWIWCICLPPLIVVTFLGLFDWGVWNNSKFKTNVSLCYLIFHFIFHFIFISFHFHFSFFNLKWFSFKKILNLNFYFKFFYICYYLFFTNQFQVLIFFCIDFDLLLILRDYIEMFLKLTATDGPGCVGGWLLFRLFEFFTEITLLSESFNKEMFSRLTYLLPSSCWTINMHLLPSWDFYN